MKIEKNTSKISVLIASSLCSILVLSMISPAIESSKAFAIDHTYYVQQYTEKYKQLQQIITQTSEMEKQISDLKTSNALDADLQIQHLQQQIDENKNKRQSLVKDLDHIQDETRALFQVDPSTKKKLDDASAVLYDMYLNKKSPNYVGDNPVQEIMANYEYKNLFVSFDVDKTKNNPIGDNSQMIIADIKKVAGDIPLDVEYGKAELIQCSTRTAPCSPLLAGDDVQSSGKTFDCTEGYPANNFQGSSGFIMAGHCVSQVGNTVNQPAPSYTGSRQVGQVSQLCYDSSSVLTPTCDFAFTTASVSVSSFGIFKDGVALYAIFDRTPESSQNIGDIVIKSGIGSQITSGAIVGKDSAHHIQVQMNSQGGDSGSPVFKDIDGTDEHLYGMAYAKQVIGTTTYTYYFPDDYIKNTFSLQN